MTRNRPPTEADIQAGLPGQVRGLWPPNVPHWSLTDGGQIARDGVPVLVLVRAVWGEDARPAAELETLSLRIVGLLNADAEIEATLAGRAEA